MATPRLARAQAIVDYLEAQDLAATVDPAVAVTRAPCVLVPPPRVDPSDRTWTWSLVALAATTVGGPKAWAELDTLLEAVLDALPVDRADPSSYVLPDGAGSRPAYVITVTDSA